MKRSKWKGPYISFKKFHKLSKKKLIVISRNSFIIPKFIGYIFKVYKGNSFVDVLVTKEMLGHKFGEFVETRKLFTFKKKRKKNTKNG